MGGRFPGACRCPAGLEINGFMVRDKTREGVYDYEYTSGSARTGHRGPKTQVFNIL